MHVEVVEPVTDRGATASGRLLRRTAPVAVGACLCAGAVLLAANDPAAPGSRFPACSFRQLTGWWCPGCGLTRGTHSLLNGDLLGAVAQNVFVPFVAVVVVGVWWAWLWRSWDRPAPVVSRFTQAVGASRWRSGLIALLVVAVAYGALRNVPTAPFDALAP